MSDPAGPPDRPPDLPPALASPPSTLPAPPPPPPSSPAGWSPPAPGPAPAEPGGVRARRLHPSSPVLDLIVTARQYALPVAALAFGSARSWIVGPVFLLAVAVLVGSKVLSWSRFTYRLQDDVLTIEHGVFQRSRREVPVARIQQVDLRRRLRHRVLGVAVVRIDTAGGGSGAEVTLEAIADEQAHLLRSALLRRAAMAGAPLAAPLGSGGDPADPAAVAPVGAEAQGPPAEPVVVVRLDTRDLVVAGLTGSRLGAGLALAGAAYGLFVELPAGISEDLAELVPSGAAALVLGLVAAVPVLLVLAVASSILTDHEYTLVRAGTDLHLRRGLLDQREATISLQRVQVVRLHENLLRRALGLAMVQLQSAGSGSEAEGAVSRLTIPVVRRHQLDALLAQVLPAAIGHPPVVPAPPAARRRAWLRRVGPVVALTAVALAVSRSAWALLVLLLVGPAAAWAELAFRNLGHAATAGVVVARGGGLVRETAFVPVAKAQSTRLQTSPFQRRLGLATLSIDVAGRGDTPTVTDGDAARLADLRRTALRGPAARSDEEAVRRRSAGVSRASGPRTPPEPAARGAK